MIKESSDHLVRDPKLPVNKPCPFCKTIMKEELVSWFSGDGPKKAVRLIRFTCPRLKCPKHRQPILESHRAPFS